MARCKQTWTHKLTSQHNKFGSSLLTIFEVKIAQLCALVKSTIFVVTSKILELCISNDRFWNYVEKNSPHSMERHHCLLSTSLIIWGAFYIISGAFYIICGAFHIICTAFLIICGAFVIKCGTFVMICSAFYVICSAFVIIRGTFVIICSAFVFICGAFVVVCGGFVIIWSKFYIISGALFVIIIRGTFVVICGAFFIMRWWFPEVWARAIAIFRQYKIWTADYRLRTTDWVLTWRVGYEIRTQV